MLRGDLDVSETKPIQTIGVKTLTAAAEDEIRNRLGAEPGYASPLGLDPARHWVIGDESLTGLVNFVTGANEPGYHVVNANYPRDFAVTQIADVAFAPDGADCLRCGGRLSVKPAIQLGLCAQMGSVLSTPAGVTFLDPDGQRHPVFMGEYQIDLDQMLRAIVETHHDQHGIVWPAAVAPYDAHLVAIAKDETAAQAAETLYADLAAAGFDVLYDDRNLSPGVMFADADLMGMPVRLTVSPRSLSSGGVEVKQRRGGESVIAPIANLAAELPGFLTAG
jgi:prolyl-tRNA synthetase